jgi:hypothetical protein
LYASHVPKKRFWYQPVGATRLGLHQLMLPV